MALKIGHKPHWQFVWLHLAIRKLEAWPHRDPLQKNTLWGLLNKTDVAPLLASGELKTDRKQKRNFTFIWCWPSPESYISYVEPLTRYTLSELHDMEKEVTPKRRIVA